MRAVIEQPTFNSDLPSNTENDMGFFSGLHLPSISLNDVVHVVTGGIVPSSSSSSTPTASTPVATTPTHTIAGSVVAGIANAVTGGALGNGTNQNAGAYQVGQFLGNIGNNVVSQNMPSVVEAVQNQVNTTPALTNAVQVVTDVAIDTAQKTMFQRVSDWVKEHKTIVFLISLIPIYFIVKPLIFGKSRTKRSYKR